MRYLLLIPLFIFTLSANAEMYRWVDDKGHVHFSDRPVDQNTEAYEPPPLQTVPAGPGGSLKPLNKTSNKPVKYKTLSITAPTNDQVFTPDNAASINIAISLKPALQVALKHKIDLYVDGKLHASGNQLAFILTDLPRGTHTVRASVLNDKGKSLISSSSISFHVQKHSR